MWSLNTSRVCWNRIMTRIFTYLFSAFPPIHSMLAGNVAWAHLCARNKLKTTPSSISGLPIFITDETPVTDAVRFTQRVNVDMDLFKIKPTSWSVPFLLCYMLAMLLEMALKLINVFTRLQVTYCPRGMLAFGSSLILYDRLRSAISLDYEPIYTVNQGFSRSAKWYDLWYQNFKNKKLSDESRNWSDRQTSRLMQPFLTSCFYSCIFKCYQASFLINGISLHF